MSVTIMKRLAVILPIFCLLVAAGIVMHQYWRLGMLQQRLESLRGATSRASVSEASAHPEADHSAAGHRD